MFPVAEASVIVAANPVSNWDRPKGRKGAPMREMVPTPTNGTARFFLSCEFQQVQLNIPFPQVIEGEQATFLPKSIS